ncbi:macrophage mannose receptor 1-like isoform X2 [Anneissia japonica]|uniref:macrophage mannose receptor 1-like isoform X2 n=1 Tax=Anneissia japonica TaxID=1529436 RepID=UPI0014255022|nr:macrophage mannose receptor 1-like isoform X2 [Anneissia japonica]
MLRYIAVIIAIAHSVNSQRCPNGWQRYGDSCYLIRTDLKNWYEARLACESDQGDLAVVKTADVNTFLTGLIKNTGSSHWIGLHDTSNEGDFVWIDSTPLDPNTAQWNNGEPNNYGSGEDCTEMSTNGKWNDLFCTYTRRYICERSADIPINCDESDGWYDGNGKCYKFMNRDASWDDAVNYCTSVDAELVSIKSQDEQNIVTYMVSIHQATAWIGLSDKNSGSAGMYEWSNGDPYSLSAHYNHWATNQPDNRFYTQGGNCVEILNTAKTGEWNTAPCTNLAKSICRKEEGTCAPGWRLHKGYCYQFNDNNAHTWTDSKHYCEAQGAYLTSILSNTENDFIQKQFEDLSTVGITDYWIGISDYASDGIFQWSEGTTTADYSNWNPNMPKNVPNQPDCGKIFVDDAAGKWDSDNCFLLLAFVCKAKVGTNIKAISPVVGVGSCPPGWSLNGNSCYKITTDADLTFDAASAACQNIQAELASIHDEDTQSFMSLKTEIAQKYLWVGLHDTSNEGKFEWLDGTPYDFTNWAPGEPNDYGSGEDCVHLAPWANSMGEWNDLACTGTAGYICQMPKTCETLTSGSTDDQYYYRYHDSPLYESRVDFEAKASNDVHIGLSSAANDMTEMYEVVIGGWNNQNSAIRRCKQCSNEVYVSTPSILNENEFRGFWITWDDAGKISVGKAGQSAFMEWTDPNPLTIAYVGYSTGWDSNGEFRFCDLTSGGSVPPDPQPTPIFNSRCGLGWEYDALSGSCYLFRTDDFKSWNDAEFVCNNEGGYLTSITNLQEQSYINARIVYINEGALWTGGNDKTTEGGWRWSDGSPFAYLNWNAGEPNNVGALGEHCLELYSKTGLWNDQSCSNTLGYICKKDGYIVSHYNTYPNSAIEGYNNIHLTDVFPEDCAKRCIGETSFTCRSFDYYKNSQECDLSDKDKDMVGGLKTTYDGSPYDHYERLMDATTEMPPTTPPPGYRCRDGWNSYDKYCYFLSSTDGTWSEARDNCRGMGGDLASIHNDNENNYINSLQTAASSGNIWIGLNDLTYQMSFTWSDGSDMDYAIWNTNEPNNHQGSAEDCVEMYTNKAWNDNDCVNRRRFICKRKKENLPPTQFPPTPSGCDQGWIAYDYSCYMFVSTTTVTSDSAIQSCLSMAGHLVSINDRFEQTFISSQLGLASGQYYWCGLVKQDDGSYTWSDGSSVAYTNWDKGQPDDRDGKCVAVSSGKSAGLWSDSACDSSYNYICEKLRFGFTDKPIVTYDPTDPSSSGCAPGWIGYGNNCYRINEVSTTKQLKTWSEASSFCRAQGGNLASFHTSAEEKFIKNAAKVADSATGYWIGLSDQTKENGFTWTDGTPVDYTNWENGEPNNVNEEDCVEMFFSTRNWNDIGCDRTRHWVCKIAKGSMPVTVAPPNTPTAYPLCPGSEGWIRYDNYCYYFSKASGSGRLSWQEADGYCHVHNGKLASIHNEPEMNFINDNTDITISSYWIGLREYEIRGVYTWSDSTPFDYVNWAPGEPNDFNGEEQCVELYTSIGSWNDLNCGDKIPFICKKPFGSIVTNAPPTTALPQGNCPSGWIEFNKRCYQFHGSIESDRFGWRDARDKCRNVGGDLVTIHDQRVNAFLTTKLKGLDYRMWIGLSDLTTNKQFRWTDGTTVDYTNWAGGEPNEAGGGEDCVELIGSEYQAGLWNDNSCDKMNGYICQDAFDSNAPEPPVTSTTCQSGYRQYYDGCFQYVDGSFEFSKAITTCTNLGNGASIANVVDVYEQAFIEQIIGDNGGGETWIGMVDDKIAGEYRWVNGWPVWYTKWGSNEPSYGPGEGCVMIDAKGYWDDTKCNDQHPVLCKYSLAPIPTNPPDLPGTCPTDWEPFGSYCYYFELNGRSTISWPEAQFSCARIGAHLASIHTKADNDFISKKATDSGLDLWVGLYRTDAGGFAWSDNTPVDYTNWNDGEPSLIHNGEHENCVEVLRPYGKWNDIECYNNQGYVCRIDKTPLTGMTTKPNVPKTTQRHRTIVKQTTKKSNTERPTPPPQKTTRRPQPPRTTDKDGGSNEQTQTPLGAGAIAGLCVAALAAILLVIIITYFVAGRSTRKHSDPTGMGSVGFDNALYNAGSNSVQVDKKDLDYDA